MPVEYVVGPEWKDLRHDRNRPHSGPDRRMRRHPIASSSLRTVGYDADTEILEIEYVNGGLYRYFAVPLLVHRQLLRSGTPGTFVNQRIKPFYSFKEVT